MGRYQRFEDNNDAYIEQNIFDNGELESYEAKINCGGEMKTAALCYYEDDGKRFYSLGITESLKDRNMKIVSGDLSEILKYKTASVRRKRLYMLIREHEQELSPAK